jgi:DNA mismatch repair protein MutL
MANHQLHIVLFHDGKNLFEVFKQKNRSDRVSEIFGSDFVKQSLSYKFDSEHMSLTGFIGKPQLSLRSPSRQYLFVNGRSVRNYRLSKAIREAYGSLLEPKAQPAFILYLNLPPQFFDTNIHPRKEEVLIFKEDELITKIFDHLQNFLQTKDLTYVLKTDANSTGYLLRDRATEDEFKANLESGWQVRETDQLVKEVFQFQDTYLFFELAGELMVVDQHAAHEMILYNDFLKQFEKNKFLEEKKVIVNKKINLTKENYFIFEQNKNIFSKLGFIFSLTDKELNLESSPTLFASLDLERVILDLLDDVSHYGKIVKPDLLTNRALSFLACRSAIKGGDYLTPEQRQNLVKKIIKENTLYTCPHGRPLKIKISKQELEKMFFRKK